MHMDFASIKQRRLTHNDEYRLVYNCTSKCEVGRMCVLYRYARGEAKSTRIGFVTGKRLVVQWSQPS